MSEKSSPIHLEDSTLAKTMANAEPFAKMSIFTAAVGLKMEQRALFTQFKSNQNSEITEMRINGRAFKTVVLLFENQEGLNSCTRLYELCHTKSFMIS